MAGSFFDMTLEENLSGKSPLADRMRPRNIEEFVGQRHIAGSGKLLYRMIKADRISSMIFAGPAGCGKTTLAKIIAQSTKSEFVSINAVTSGVGDIKKVIDDAKKLLGAYNKPTILFIDEIHRFNKSQQDALLPSVEKGIITMIGATTENPHFEINSALLSRSTLITLNELTENDIKTIVRNAISDEERGLGKHNITLTDDALDFLARVSSGDGRAALNALELAFLSTNKNEDGIIHIDLAVMEDCVQKRTIKYDKNGNEHYDTISAFIKSMRGSDPDSAIYWLAKMLYAGEDPKFIARRMVIFASEDIGCADSSALELAVSTFRAVEIIGLPEARINLAHCAVYLSCAPKSNASYMALNMAMEDIEKNPTAQVPPHLRSTGHKLSNDKDAPGYKYPHDYPKHFVKQDYRPKGHQKQYYFPTEIGYEKRLKAYMEYIRTEENK